MAMENGPFEDVFPIEDGDFPASHVSLLECKLKEQRDGPCGDLEVLHLRVLTKSWRF